jgi:hypothetical protein
MDKSNIDEIKLGGAKKKNGHKSNCSCHICENMKNKAKRGGYSEEIEKEAEYISGGSKKKNGHRKNCQCPICKNMKNAKRGGGDDSFLDENEDKMENKDKMENEESKGGKKKGNGHKPDCQCPICKNMRKSKRGGEPDEENQMGDIEEAGIKGTMESSKINESKASDDDYDELDAAERGEHNPAGGSRRRKRSNKKTTRNRRKTRRNRNSRKRRH